jgi:nucleobase:cation symporter-1, NCS1 family
MATHEHDSLLPVVPEDRTLNGFNTLRLWLAANFVITTVMTGALFIPDLTPLEAITAIICGTLVGAVPLALVGVIGARTGLATMMTFRRVFGVRGANVPATANAVILIGWMWIQAFMAGFSLNYVIEHTLGYSNPNLFILLTGILVVAIAFKGHKGIERLESVIAVAMLVTFIISMAQIFYSYDVADFFAIKKVDKPSLTWITAFDVVVATGFTWMPLVGDFNRHCKNSKTSFWGCVSGYSLGGIMAMTLGVVVAVFSIQTGLERTYDPTVLLVATGIGSIAAIVVFLSVVSTNVMCIYGASFSLMTVFPSLHYRTWVIGLGIISVLGALLKELLMASFLDFVLVIATLFIPIFAILLVDYFVINGGSYRTEDIVDSKLNAHSSVKMLALCCYVLGAVFAYTTTYIYPLDFGSTIATFMFSSLIYYIAKRCVGEASSSVTIGNKTKEY